MATGRWATGSTDGGEAPAVYSPSRFDPVVRAASAIVGGPAGRRTASRVGFWGAAPILILLAAAMLSFGVVEKQHCRIEGWSSPDQFWHACYSDIPVLYGSAGLGEDNRRGLTDSVGQGGLGQPPLAGALMWVTSSVVPADGPHAARHFFDLSTVLLTGLLVVAVGSVTLIVRRRPWDAAHLALSPVIVTAGLISYELLAVALTAAALLALSRARPVAGGILMGLAVASAPQVAVIGLVIAVLGARYLRGTRTGLGTLFATTAVGTWLVLRILLLPGFTGQLKQVAQNWVDQKPGYGSFWLLPQLLSSSRPQEPHSIPGKVVVGVFGWIFRIGPLSGTTSAFLALVVLGALVLAILRYTVFEDPIFNRFADAPEAEEVDVLNQSVVNEPIEDDEPLESRDLGRFVSDKVAPLSLALLAAMLVVSKSLPIQVSLLMLPLIALSGLRWRDHLIWAGTEMAYFVAIWLYIGGESMPSRGMPATFYLVFLAIRVAGIVWIGVQGVLAYRVPPEGLPVDDPDPVLTEDGSWAISFPDSGEGRLLDDRGASTSQPTG